MDNMNYWLMKTEPSAYSIDDLMRKKTGSWDGVRNYQARNLMRDHMEKGDLALFYHSSAEVIGVAGVLEITSRAYPDPTQFDPKADHYDKKATKERPIWYLVDIAFKEKFKRVVTLVELKNDPFFNDMVVTQRGSRLSIQPVQKKHFDRILELANSHDS